MADRGGRRLTGVLLVALISVLVSGGLLPLGGTAAYADQIRDGQWYLDYLGVRQAHKISQGEGVTVAVVDTGVDADHPDLRGNVVAGADRFSSGKGFRDYHNHGTGMASLIAGHGHGGGHADGVLGIAPKAKIMPVTVMGPDARGAEPSAIADGIAYAVEHGAGVVLVALTGPPDKSQTSAVQYAQAHDVLVVASAGQSEYGTGGPVAYPAGVSGVMAVSAVDRHGEFARWSASGVKIALAAPGVDLPQARAGGGYATAKGTSGAAAIVAGMAALVRAEFPAEDYAAVSRRLAYTAVDKGPKGRDQWYGFGVPDVKKALELRGAPDLSAAPSTSPSTPSSPVASGVAEPVLRAPAPGMSPAGIAGVVVLTVVALALLAGIGYLAVRWSQAAARNRPPPATTPPDAAPPQVDAGPPPQVDAGPSPRVDAGPPQADAGGPASLESPPEDVWKRPGSG